MSHRELRSFLVTTEDGAKMAGVTVDLIHQWARRGYLTKHGSSRMGLWDWREIAAVNAAPRRTRRRVA